MAWDELSPGIFGGRRPEVNSWSALNELEEETEFFQSYYQNQLLKAQEVAAEVGISLKTHLETGHPIQAIVKAAEDGNFDLIVLGHRGLSGVWATLLSSVAEKVSRHALIVRWHLDRRNHRRQCIVHKNPC